MQTLVHNQAKLDQAIRDAKADIHIVGGASVAIHDSAHVTAHDSAHVTAYDSAHVRAYDSAQVTAYDSAQVRACGSAQVTACGSAHVTAYDSAQVRAYDSAQVRACGSAQVTAHGSARVTAHDSAQVRAYDSAQARATPVVAVTLLSADAVVAGGVQIRANGFVDFDSWATAHGVEQTQESAILYKAVDDDFRSPHHAQYTPGATAQAADWDGGKDECGGGLHFSPQPGSALAFNLTASRFVACRVQIADIAVTENATYPHKVKARACKVLYECDIDGKKLEAAEKEKP